MKYLVIGFALLASSAIAQTVPTGPSVPPGQNASGAIDANSFSNNSDPVGFNETSYNAAVAGAGTTQATATLLQNRMNVITACAAGAGVRLPAVNKYVAITVINRSGGSCIVYPTIGATVETALGTNGAVNAGATVATNTDTIFRPISPTAWVQ